MMREWTNTPVGEAFEIDPARPLSKGSTTAFLPMDAIAADERQPTRIETRQYSGSGAKFQNGDTLIARITPCLENGKTCFVAGLNDGEVGHGSTEYIVLTGRPSRTDNLFAYYLARSDRFRQYAIGQMEGTSGRQRVPSKAIAKYTIELPPLPEQRAIAHVLGSLDDKIELNRRANQTLEAMAQAVFKDWFVDFAPVLAKSEKREPYLANELWDALPNRIDGGVPLGWTRGPVGDWVTFNPTEALRKGVVAQYLDMAALPTEGATADQPVPRAYGSGMKFRNGDTLMARITPCLENGKTAFVHSLPDDAVAWGSTEFIVMRPIAPVPRPYGYLLARDAAFRDHAIRSMTGTSGRQRAQVQAIASFPVCLPTDESVWKAFAAVVDPLFAGIRANAEESRTLADLRDVLLPKLMSGDIRIKDAERFVEEATT
jgi:type I restriction enzyme S subunit